MRLYLHKLFLPLIFVVINILSKSFHLTSQSICLDEPFTIYHAQFDLANLIHYLEKYNNPPLFEIILHFWIKLFGIGPESVRVLPMLFSAITVFFIYKLVIEFFDKRSAILASVIYTLSTLNIWFAHDCRVYSLFVLLTVISFYLFFKLLKETSEFKTRYIIFFSFTNLLLIYGHYFGFIVLGIEFLIVCLFFLRSKNVIKKYAIVSFISLAAYIPQLMVLWMRTKQHINNGTWVEPPKGAESLYNMLWSFCNEPIPTVTCILLLLAATIIFFIRKKETPVNPYTMYIIIWFLVPFLGMFLISYKTPMYIDRYLIFVSPAFYILLALSISYLFKDRKKYVIAACFLTLIFFFSADLDPSKKNDVDDAVSYIKSKKDNKTIVIGCGYNFELNFTYYYNIEHFKLKNQNTEYGTLDTSLKYENVYFVNNLNDKLISTINNFEKIVYLDASSNFSLPNNRVKETLYEKYKFIGRTFFYRDFNIYAFSVNTKKVPSL